MANSDYPDMLMYLRTYGTPIKNNPPYILFGIYVDKKAKNGILYGASNEFYAHILRREINKKGFCTVERSEFHPNPTFYISIYKLLIKKKTSNGN